MEPWIFDRSGVFCGDAFRLETECTKFLSIMYTYTYMSDPELGSNPVIKADTIGKYIRLKDKAQILGEKLLYIDDTPIARREDIVGYGTTCYRAKLSSSGEWKYVVKFKWPRASARARAEEEMLQFIKEKDIWGVVNLEYHDTLTCTENVRQGLQLETYRKFRPEKYNGFQNSGKTIENQGFHSGKEGIDQYTQLTERYFENRILCCTAISPIGRPLETFKNTIELLRNLRDAVKAHRSLFQKARVLHQDISSGNILITDFEDDEEPKGIPIDFDVAMQIDVGPRTTGEITGTRPFMSIGVLKGRLHRYRHDLESFLYVLLWTIISNRNENPPKSSRLRKWVSRPFEELAEQKLSDMRRNEFEKITSEFLPQYQSLIPLAEKLRQLLFPPQEDGTLWTGTNGSLKDTNELYDSFIDAFNGAIVLHQDLESPEII